MPRSIQEITYLTTPEPFHRSDDNGLVPRLAPTDGYRGNHWYKDQHNQLVLPAIAQAFLDTAPFPLTREVMYSVRDSGIVSVYRMERLMGGGFPRFFVPGGWLSEATLVSMDASNFLNYYYPAMADQPPCSPTGRTVPDPQFQRMPESLTVITGRLVRLIVMVASSEEGTLDQRAAFLDAVYEAVECGGREAMLRLIDTATMYAQPDPDAQSDVPDAGELGAREFRTMVNFGSVGMRQQLLYLDITGDAALRESAALRAALVDREEEIP